MRELPAVIIMVATPAIHRLPTDVMSKVIQFLPVADLKSLRQASQWAEMESFNDFVACGYKTVTLCVSRPAIDRLERVLQQSKRLASSVRALVVYFQEYKEASVCSSSLRWLEIAEQDAEPIDQSTTSRCRS